uniref:MADF domain-containing protein n=1 Tax=Stomoxys calcitrans TaxID=35570 RepID=A0A1I8PMM5_STOCA
MDARRLIEEVRKRPKLWNIQYRKTIASPKETYHLWREVADACNVLTVDECKCKWKNLRDSYRRYVSRCKKEGKQFTPKGIYFDEMEFVREQRIYRKSKPKPNQNEKAKQGSNSETNGQSQNVGEIKCEAIEISDNEDASELGSYEDNDDLSMYEFQDIQKISDDSTSSQHFSNIDEVVNQSPEENPIEQRTLDSLLIPTVADGGEQNLGQINLETSKNSLLIPLVADQKEQNIGVFSQETPKPKEHNQDSELNFLISFLPHMKKMTDMQNLQFRVRMSELVCKILAPSLTQQT